MQVISPDDIVILFMFFDCLMNVVCTRAGIAASLSRNNGTSPRSSRCKVFQSSQWSQTRTASSIALVSRISQKKLAFCSHPSYAGYSKQVLALRNDILYEASQILSNREFKATYDAAHQAGRGGDSKMKLQSPDDETPPRRPPRSPAATQHHGTGHWPIPRDTPPQSPSSPPTRSPSDGADISGEVEVPLQQLPGALVLLHEVGELDVVIELGETFLRENAIPSLVPDVATTVALAHCDFAARIMASSSSSIEDAYEELEVAAITLSKYRSPDAQLRRGETPVGDPRRAARRLHRGTPSPLGSDTPAGGSTDRALRDGAP